MKVLQVIDTLKAGGAERVFVDMVNILAKAGIEVEVLLLNESGALEAFLKKEVPVHCLSRVNKFSPAKAFEAHKLCKRFDIVHVHMRHCYSYIRAVQFGFAGRYKVIMHDHFGDIGINSKVPLGLKLPSPPRVYIGVSQELQSWASEYVKPERNFLLRNTIAAQPTDRLHPITGNKAIMIANIRPTKNIEFAIDLCEHLGIELDIYGNRSDAAYYDGLMRRISENNDIRIIEGVTDFSRLFDNYRFALHTAVSETGPLVLLEYMACGIPFVCYKTGEVANVVAKDLPGLFVESFDIDKWEYCIKRIGQNEGLSRKLQALFNEHFSTENYLNQCLQIYQDVDC